jgi:hypothetical protein
VFCGFYLQFCSEDWSEDMEKELCLLWDMTVEADVADLLMQHDFLDLASRIIHDTTIPRLMVSYDCSAQCDNSDQAVQLLQLALWLAQTVLVWLLEFIGHKFVEVINWICTFNCLLSL